MLTGNIVSTSAGVTNTLLPTKADMDWTDTTRKLIGALGIAFLIPMALKLEFEQGIYLPIILDDIPDNPTDPVFRYVVVTRAI
eukprot:2786610-Rhodomonas_salina.1